MDISGLPDGGFILEKREILFLTHLRTNARNKLASISRNTGIPVSTLFDKLKNYEKDIIKRHTALLDFGKLGFDVRVQIILKTNTQSKEQVREFLMKNALINSFYRINNGYDYMVEAVFKNMNEYQNFIDRIEEYGIKKKNEYFILQEFKRESFLADKTPTLFH